MHNERVVSNNLFIVIIMNYALFLEQPINLSGRPIESTITRFDIALSEACYHQDALLQTNGVTACRQGLLVDVYFR